MKNKKKFEISTDGALIFSAIMIIVFTAVILFMYWNKTAVPDSLIVAFFACFSFEGGYCAYIYKIRKSHKEEDEDGSGNDQIDC